MSNVSEESPEIPSAISDLYAFFPELKLGWFYDLF